MTLRFKNHIVEYDNEGHELIYQVLMAADIYTDGIRRYTVGDAGRLYCQQGNRDRFFRVFKQAPGKRTVPVRSKYLPPRVDPYQVEKDLQAWAQKRKLKLHRRA